MHDINYEFLDFVDSDDRVIGQAARGDIHRRGLRHRAVHVLVFDAQGRIFLQKRSAGKASFPRCWDSSSSGHVDAGEDYDHAAVRELEEELGLKIQTPLEKLFKIAACEQTDQEFVWVYRCRSEGPFALNPDEIESGGWFAPANVTEWVKRVPADFADSFVLIWKLLNRENREGHEEGWLDEVRRSCRETAELADFVQIAGERIPAYVDSLPIENAAPEIDPKHHYLGQGDKTAAFFLTLDTVNFGSGYFPHLRKRPGMSGYYTIASSLNDVFKKHGPFTARELAEIDERQCAEIFDQEMGDAAVNELMGLFTRAWNDFGRLLLDKYDGSFTALIEAANHSAEKLVRLLAEMPSYRDAAQYKGRTVSFYKRAQIAASDLALAFHGEDYGRFDDLGRLTIFADNVIPHVLRCDGILNYTDSLAKRIKAEELIPAGSPEEIEIRACAVHTAELMVEYLQKSGRRITAMQLDNILWNRGQQSFYKLRPRHRTRTVFY